MVIGLPVSALEKVNNSHGHGKSDEAAHGHALRGLLADPSSSGSGHLDCAIDVSAPSISTVKEIVQKVPDVGLLQVEGYESGENVIDVDGIHSTTTNRGLKKKECTFKKSCTGEDACELNSGTVGRGSCNGDASCYYQSGAFWRICMSKLKKLNEN
jgi:hypothetical protein